MERYVTLAEGIGSFACFLFEDDPLGLEVLAMEEVVCDCLGFQALGAEGRGHHLDLLEECIEGNMSCAKLDQNAAKVLDGKK